VAAIDRALAPLTPRVLVVEDDAQLADVICTALQPDFDVSLARTGHEAIELAQRTRPDALVLDLTLPGPDGFEVIEALGSGEPSEVPVIVYTAQELTDAERARLSHGRDVRFLTKGRTAPVELGPQVMAAVRDRTLRGRESVDA
jgi:DNA-binding response OmpR family regulator